MILIRLPDGSRREAQPGVCVRDIANEIDPQLSESTVCASVNEKLRDVRDRLTEDCSLTFHTAMTPEGRKVVCHTAAHIAAHAVKRLFPAVTLGVGLASSNGFYHDFEVGRPFAREELARIETEMSRIVEEDLPIERCEMSKGDVRTLLIRFGEVLRVELLEEIDASRVSLYRQGEYIDLCHGPHVSSTGRVPSAHLTGLATANWRDDPHAERLNRVYGMVDRPDQLSTSTRRVISSGSLSPIGSNGLTRLLSE